MSSHFPNPISEVILVLACICKFDTQYFIADLSFLWHWKPHTGKQGQLPSHHALAILTTSDNLSCLRGKEKLKGLIYNGEVFINLIHCLLKRKWKREATKDLILQSCTNTSSCSGSMDFWDEILHV